MTENRRGTKLPAAAKKSIPKTVGKVFAFIGVFVLIVALTLFLTLKIICAYKASKTAFVTTVLESGQMGFLASVAVSQSEIDEIRNSASLEDVGDITVNEGMITPPQPSQNGQAAGDDLDSIEIVDIAGLTYKATLMIIKDPSRVSVASVATGYDQWPNVGVPLKELVESAGAIGGVNGGIYNSTNNCGGNSYGVLVSNGVILRNRPKEWGGLVLVGLTKSNLLQIIDISKMSAEECKKMIEEKEIRDAVCFPETYGDHFVRLVMNGEPREVKGAGSGLNPRTAVGQRADGAILLLVTDGRGYKGHVGASAADLIEIMTRYGAVNAANIDGGSSTCMYYNGKYLQDSVTFYYSQSSWKLPAGFVVK